MPGETARITLPITIMDLSYYDEAAEDWTFESGEFTVSVGTSSRDIRLQKSVEL